MPHTQFSSKYLGYSIACTALPMMSNNVFQVFSIFCNKVLVFYRFFKGGY
jgi:hypothetical protein